MNEFVISDHILKGWQVLVVDDEGDTIEIVQTILEYCGAHVLSASNGQDGFQLALTHRPRFIISDLSMPEMDGWSMLNKLKTTPATADIPVIALTAHAIKGDRERAFGAGFHNYLTKPLRPETFAHDLLSLLIDVPSIREDLKHSSEDR